MPAPMDSDEFNDLMYAFGGDMEEITNRLHSAKKGRITGKEAEQAVTAAREKLAAYETLLKNDRFNDLRRSQAADQYDESIGDIRRMLDTIAQTKNK